MRLLYFSLAILLLYTFLGCTRSDRKSEAGSGEVPVVLPAYSLEAVTHYQYEAGKLKIMVMFEYGDFFEEYGGYIETRAYEAERSKKNGNTTDRKFHHSVEGLLTYRQKIERLNNSKNNIYIGLETQ